MKFSTLGGSLLAFAAATEACIRVHVFLHNDPVIGDGMTVQIYDGYDFKCRDGAHTRWASEDTKWKFKCGEDDRYEVHLISDGTEGYVWNHNAGWEGKLTGRDFKHKVDCTYKTGVNERCAGYTSTSESTLWDEFEDCDAKLFNTENCGNGQCDISEKDTPCLVNYNGRCEPVIAGRSDRRRTGKM
ncbi:hypothetical protein FE257_004179 [Aspergillus nanangensis]|uniref:Uncharacterized protein n=1 Tax=Aspergillus nanangensis TaxID=2582783 RepID=A0AAD4CRF4_ASPNN|nr:hypothetical protein FE257_004179 [Aspergillus nanangensis]